MPKRKPRDRRTCGCRGTEYQVCDKCQRVTGNEKDTPTPEAK